MDQFFISITWVKQVNITVIVGEQLP